MKLYTKPTKHDNRLISPTLTSPARLSEYQPKPRWRPGDPLPKLGQPDAPAALARNADAFALDEAARQNKILPFKQKAGAPPAIIRDGGLEAA
jgi:hypothetical protein